MQRNGSEWRVARQTYAPIAMHSERLMPRHSLSMGPFQGRGSALGKHASVALGSAAQAEQSYADPQGMWSAGDHWNLAALLQGHDQIKSLQSAAGNH